MKDLAIIIAFISAGYIGAVGVVIYRDRVEYLDQWTNPVRVQQRGFANDAEGLYQEYTGENVPPDTATLSINSMQ